MENGESDNISRNDGERIVRWIKDCQEQHGLSDGSGLQSTSIASGSHC